MNKKNTQTAQCQSSDLITEDRWAELTGEALNRVSQYFSPDEEQVIRNFIHTAGCEIEAVQITARRAN